MTREEITRMSREADLQAEYDDYMLERLERFAALVAAAERNSWPAEMEAMERQVNILTDALAQAKAEEREAILQISCDQWFKTQADFEEAIRARGETK